MTLRPLPGVPIDRVIAELREIELAASNAGSQGGDGWQLLDRYERWIGDSLWKLGHTLGQKDRDALLTSQRYWALRAVDHAFDATPETARSVTLELEERQRALSAVRETLEAEVVRWTSSGGVLVVPDTNVLIHHSQMFDSIPWAASVSARIAGVRVILPLTVVDELDRLKRTGGQHKVDHPGNETVRSRARRTLRRLDELLPRPTTIALIQPETQDAGRVTIEIAMDAPGHTRAPSPDQEIIDQAVVVKAVVVKAVSGREVILATYDTDMRMRARASGLEARTPIEATDEL